MTIVMKVLESNPMLSPDNNGCNVNTVKKLLWLLLETDPT